MKGETGMNRNGQGPWKHDVNEGRQGRGRERTATGAPNARAGRRAEQRRSGFVPQVEPWPERVEGREFLDELAATLKPPRLQTTRNCAELRWIAVNYGKPKNKVFVVPGARTNQIIASAKMRKGVLLLLLLLLLLCVFPEQYPDGARCQ